MSHSQFWYSWYIIVWMMIWSEDVIHHKLVSVSVNPLSGSAWYAIVLVFWDPVYVVIIQIMWKLISPFLVLGHKLAHARVESWSDQIHISNVRATRNFTIFKWWTHKSSQNRSHVFFIQLLQCMCGIDITCNQCILMQLFTCNSCLHTLWLRGTLAMPWRTLY